MNYIVDSFDEILGFAKEYGLVGEKKRAILREYLQSKIVELLYQEKISVGIFFVGGTSLRLLRGLPRFSEDLDFDVINISSSQIKTLVETLKKRLIRERIDVDLYQNVTKRRAYFEFRFNDLLYQLKLSTNKDEKLMIKLDFEHFWRFHKREVVFFSRYGLLANVVTIPLDHILVQKLVAYINRKQTLPRDMYDIVWLTSHGAKIDYNFIKRNKLPSNLVIQAREKFISEEKRLRGFMLKLRPFLIDERETSKLTLFLQVLEKF